MVTKRKLRSEDNDYSTSAVQSRGRTSRGNSQSDREARRRAEYLAELENLADYNKPPLSSRSRVRQNRLHPDDEVRSKRARASTPIHEPSTPAVVNKPIQLQQAKTAKPRAKAPPRKAHLRQKRILAELVQLQRWPGWVSEEEESASDGELDSYRPPRIHSRRYPPKVPGVQNTPWSELPSEIRNLIYGQCIADEEKKTITIVHYPHGVPRRSVRGVSSTTNFAHSYWGFTQSCMQVRLEFMPWLLGKRQTRTPLATLNNYVDTFHRQWKDGDCIGSIEPFSCGTVLGRDGIDVLNLLKFDQLNPEVRFCANSNYEAEEPTLWAGHFDELDIFHDMRKAFADLCDVGYPADCIKSIHLGSRIKEQMFTFENSDPSNIHEIRIKLDFNLIGATRMLQTSESKCLREFIWRSILAERERIVLLVCDENEIMPWRVTERGFRKTRKRLRKHRD